MEYIPAKTIVSGRSKGGGAWFGIDYNMNIYKGCCHGCIYCDSRSECYGVIDFDRVRAKENALAVIRDDLRRKVRGGVVGTGAMSDPYNPFERELELTRHALELIGAYGFGAAIATKSTLVTRDIDVLREISENAPVLLKITITTADDDLCAKIEPHVARSSERFEAIRALSDAGIFTGVLLMPVLPFLEDSEENVLSIARMAAGAGARFVYPAFGMTLRANQREWYYQKLDELFPERELRRKYAARYSNSYSCSSPRARALWNSFKKECDSLGLLYQMQDIVRAYKQGYDDRQLTFFE